MTAYTQIGSGLALPANGTRVLDLYLDGTDRLNLLIHVKYTVAGAGISLTLYDGIGPRDPAIPYPYTQSVPNIYGSTGSTSATFEAKGEDFTLSAVDGTTFDQSVSITVDRKSGMPYLRLKFTNTDGANAATIDVFATVA